MQRTTMVPQAVWTLGLCFLACITPIRADQPPQTDSLGAFKIVGNSLVSAQQVGQVPIPSFVASFKQCIISCFSVPPTRYTSSTRPKITPNKSTGTPHGHLVFIH